MGLHNEVRTAPAECGGTQDLHVMTTVGSVCSKTGRYRAARAMIYSELITRSVHRLVLEQR